jgi:hypothetical protein
LVLVDTNDIKHPISKRYGWSVHNCSCRGQKTGLVFYPIGTKHKNVVLLVCEKCYSHRQERGTQHEQLLKWYYDIYGDSKQFRCVSGFSLKDDGSLGYRSLSQNARGPYTDETREMGSLEQRAVKEVVKGKLKTYELKNQ